MSRPCNRDCEYNQTGHGYNVEIRCTTCLLKSLSAKTNADNTDCLMMW